jgi:hypothetical protein
MTDNMTSQNIVLSSWDTLYMYNTVYQQITYAYTNVNYNKVKDM